MSKHTRWLHAEVGRWVADNLISAEQAARIRARYAEPAASLPWGLIVFFGLGAAIIGLGVILLFAYNWAEIPKFAKLGLIFGAIAAAHVGGLRLLEHPDWRSRLGEALVLLGTMGFGAGIWLIAQIYHIDEHFPNGFLIWAVGALAMAWAIDSAAHGVLAAVLVSIWAGAEALSFGLPADWSALVILLGLVPLAWRLSSAVLLTAALAALYWLLLCNAAAWGGSGAAFGNAFSLSALLIAVSILIGLDEPDSSRQVISFFGLTGFVVCAYLLTFDESARWVLRWSDVYADRAATRAMYRWLFFVLAAAAWGWVIARSLRGIGPKLARETWLCPIGLVYVQGLAAMKVADGDLLLAVAFNLICLALAGAWMVRGCREGSLRTTVLGSVLLALVVFGRYFDLFDSLAARGAVFVVFGVVLFAEGFYYRRLRREGGEPA